MSINNAHLFITNPSYLLRSISSIGIQPAHILPQLISRSDVHGVEALTAQLINGRLRINANLPETNSHLNVFCPTTRTDRVVRYQLSTHAVKWLSWQQITCSAGMKPMDSTVGDLLPVKNKHGNLKFVSIFSINFLSQFIMQFISKKLLRTYKLNVKLNL